MGPSLAICIPTRDRADALRETLLHLSQIKDLFDEIVISDDASADHTQAVVEELRGAFGRLRYLKQKAGIGSRRNANAALSLSHCRYQYLLADDGRLSPQAMAAGIARLEADPHAVAVYSQLPHSCGPRIESVGSATRYSAAEALSLVQEIDELRHPLLRTRIFQRHCYYDEKSWSDWRLVQQLLAVGPIWVIPDAFVSGPAIEEAADPVLLTADYHDSRRSDWELYFSELGITPETSHVASTVVFGRLIDILGRARIAALVLKQPMIERDFILRRRAYGQRSVDLERDWERRALMSAALERVIEYLIVTKTENVLIENGTMNLPGLLAQFETAMPSVAFQAVDRQELLEHIVQPGDALISQDWSIFNERRAAGHLDERLCRVAWSDLMSLLRLNGDAGGRLLKGPAGTSHLIAL
jgi:GT2 family glycosyltransferase